MKINSFIQLIITIISLFSIQLAYANSDDPHAHHREMMKSKSFTVEHNLSYSVPNVTLLNQYGKKVELKKLIATDSPVFMQFIFTSCATICPVLSATFGAAQKKLLSLNHNYKMISISIDPEYDQPAILKKYAQTWKANANWTFLTGNKEDILKVIKSFDALYGGNNKMYHRPYFYLRPQEQTAWTRIDGMVSTKNLLSIYKSIGDKQIIASAQ